MKKLYAIYLGKKLWQNVVDDVNSTEIWAVGGMIWHSKKKAEACILNLSKGYDFETSTEKFSIVELIPHI